MDNSSAFQILNTDDLSVGDFVTVLHGAKYGSPFAGYRESAVITEEKMIEDNSYKGDVLKIIAIQLPYIVLENLSNGMIDSPINLDLRKWKLMKLNEKYISAMLSAGKGEGKDGN